MKCGRHLSCGAQGVAGAVWRAARRPRRKSDAHSSRSQVRMLVFCQHVFRTLDFQPRNIRVSRHVLGNPLTNRPSSHSLTQILSQAQHEHTGLADFNMAPPILSRRPLSDPLSPGSSACPSPTVLKYVPRSLFSHKMSKVFIATCLHAFALKGSRLRSDGWIPRDPGVDHSGLHRSSRPGNRPTL